MGRAFGGQRVMELDRSLQERLVVEQTRSGCSGCGEDEPHGSRPFVGDELDGGDDGIPEHAYNRRSSGAEESRGISGTGRWRSGASGEQAFRHYDELVLETGLRVHNETSGSSRDGGGSDGSQTIIKRTAEEVRGQVVLENDGDSRFVWSLVGSERPDRLEGA